MALSRCILIVALIATIFFSTTSTAEEFLVGDEEGWTDGFDYQAWAADKVFHVGDILIFDYPLGQHNVFRVNGTDFKNCRVPAGAEVWNTGNDRILLESEGRRWYLCGIFGHCQNGQKIVINVLPQTQSPSPSPTPSPLASPSDLASLPLLSSPLASPFPSFLPSPSPSPSDLPSDDLPDNHNIGRTLFSKWVPRKLITIFPH